MILHVYAINWNEEHLLPSFFKHYKQADLITILDNESTDSSHDIIRAHGGKIETFKTGETLCDMVNKGIKNTCWKKSKGIADWVILQDLDEFLHFPNHPGDIKAGLSELQKEGKTICKTRGYNMFCSDEEFENVTKAGLQLSSSIWNGHRDPNQGYYDKCLAFNPNVISEINYTAGAHGIEAKGTIIIDTDSALLLHYKYTGKNYCYNRTLQIRDRLSQDNKNRGWGNQYRRTDTEHKNQIEKYYTQFGNESIFRKMYPTPTFASMKFREKKYIIDTHGRHDILSSCLLNGGVWEPHVAEYIFSYCSKPNVAFLDIGSNLGAHTAIARVAGAKKIHAFECNPITIEKIKKTIQINGWEDTITLHEVAVSNKETQYDFVLVPDNLGASYITSSHKGWPGARQAGPLVSSKPLDSMAIDLTDITNIIIKLDIEGHELQALQGMTTVLHDPRLETILIELNPVCNSIPTLLETVTTLQTYGFKTILLLFESPRNSWSGSELGQLPSFPTIIKETIQNLLEQNHVLEVAFLK